MESVLGRRLARTDEGGEMTLNDILEVADLAATVGLLVFVIWAALR